MGSRGSGISTCKRVPLAMGGIPWGAAIQDRRNDSKCMSDSENGVDRAIPDPACAHSMEPGQKIDLAGPGGGRSEGEERHGRRFLILRRDGPGFVWGLLLCNQIGDGLLRQEGCHRCPLGQVARLMGNSTFGIPQDCLYQIGISGGDAGRNGRTPFLIFVERRFSLIQDKEKPRSRCLRPGGQGRAKGSQRPAWWLAR